MSVIGGEADMTESGRHVAFSNRPSGVKHFQTVQHCNVDVTHGLALLFGIGTREYSPSFSIKQAQGRRRVRSNLASSVARGQWRRRFRSKGN
jgi:hypothetical protein